MIMENFLNDYSKYEIGIIVNDEMRYFKGWYCDKRENRDIVPKEYFVYDFRSSDYDEDDYLSTIEPCVSVNHSGTFICKEKIPFGDDGNSKSFKIRFGQDW